MTRYSLHGKSMCESEHGAWVKFDDMKTSLDKPAALLALMAYGDGKFNVPKGYTEALWKLAAAIIAEVEAGE